MPIDVDIRDHEVLGPMFREARQEGLQEGRKVGLQEGRNAGLQEGEFAILRRLIEKRFGTLPLWAYEKLRALPPVALEDLSDRILDAGNLEDLLR